MNVKYVHQSKWTRPTFTKIFILRTTRTYMKTLNDILNVETLTITHKQFEWRDHTRSQISEPNRHTYQYSFLSLSSDTIWTDTVCICLVCCVQMWRNRKNVQLKLEIRIIAFIFAQNFFLFMPQTGIFDVFCDDERKKNYKIPNEYLFASFFWLTLFHRVRNWV